MNTKDFFEPLNNSFTLPRWKDLPDIELYMDQVITLMTKFFGSLSSSDELPLTPSMINNYVKNGIIPSPIKKKYSRTHLFRLIIICVMKPVLPILDISRLIETMLESKTEAEVLDFFAEQYEKELQNTFNTLYKAVEEHSKESDNESEILCFTIMHAAAISGSSKSYAENLLSYMNREDQTEEKPKKEKKEKKKAAKPEE